MRIRIILSNGGVVATAVSDRMDSPWLMLLLLGPGIVVTLSLAAEGARDDCEGGKGDTQVLLRGGFWIAPQFTPSPTPTP